MKKKKSKILPKTLIASKSNVKKAEIVPSSAISPTNTLQQYLYEVSKYPLLSKEEELKWSILYHKEKDLQALKVLVQSNLRFVIKIASQYSRFGSKLIDLIQEGNIGLLKAINEFNPYKGTRLITYAVWWIRGAIQEYLMRQHSMVRIGTTPKQKKLFYLLRKTDLPQLQSDQQTLLLSSKTGIQKKEIESMKTRLSSSDVSLDQNPHTNTHQTEDSLSDQYQNKQEIHLLRNAVKHLKKDMNQKELYILENRILSHEPKTLQEIGNHFQVTREFIRQIESRLLKKIKTEVKQSISIHQHSSS